jgi:hypothetical protein
MKRKAGALALLAALSGCVSTEKSAPQSPGQFGGVTRAREIAGAQGPWGEPVPVTTAKPADAKKDSGVATAAAKKDSGVVTAAGKKDGGGVVTANAVMPAGAPKDAGVVQTNFGRGGGGLNAPPPGAVAAVGALPGIPIAGGPAAMGARTSVRFTSPAGMKIAWFAPSPMSLNGFTPTMVEVPGRYNFVQGGIYRLKLTQIPNRPSLELYPTLEVRPVCLRSATFLAHSAVPVSFTEEDFEQVMAGNFVVKVIYLPDPQFQDLAVAGPDEVVSTRLEPGVDPILEAERRGAVLCVVRLGNIDLESPNTPALNAPPSGGPFAGMPLMAAPGAVPPGALPPGAYPPGAYPQGTVPPGAYPPGAYPQGTYPQGTYPPGTVPPGAYPPGTLPPGTLPPGTMPRALPPGTMPPVPNVPPIGGRASVGTPNAPPTMTLPDVPQPAGQVNASVEGVLGRMK